jgi:hypothetical protein
MFDKPGEDAIDKTFQLGDELILHDIRMGGEVMTHLGEARETRMTVAKTSAPELKFEVTSLGAAFERLAERRSEDDLPAVVRFETVTTNSGREAKTLTFLHKPDGSIPF